MNRIARIVAAALVASALLLAGTAGGALPRAQLRGYVCQRALDPASRAIAVTSVMRPVSGTQTMMVRFELFSRPSGTVGYSAVTGTDLGRWLGPADRSLGSRPGDVWILNKPVVDLPAPAAYRFRVTFRWLGAHRHVLAQAVRSSPICRQPELRPDLVIRRIGPLAANKKGTLDLYPITIANAGATAAGPFTVELAAPGKPAVTTEVARLGAHQTTQVTLRGPLCSSATPPVVTVDPYDQVDDYDRANNVAKVSCTSATAPSPAG